MAPLTEWCVQSQTRGRGVAYRISVITGDNARNCELLRELIDRRTGDDSSALAADLGQQCTKLGTSTAIQMVWSRR